MKRRLRPPSVSYVLVCDRFTHMCTITTVWPSMSLAKKQSFNMLAERGYPTSQMGEEPMQVLANVSPEGGRC